MDLRWPSQRSLHTWTGARSALRRNSISGPAGNAARDLPHRIEHREVPCRRLGIIIADLAIGRTRAILVQHVLSHHPQIGTIRTTHGRPSKFSRKFQV